MNKRISRLFQYILILGLLGACGGEATPPAPTDPSPTEMAPTETAPTETAPPAAAVRKAPEETTVDALLDLPASAIFMELQEISVFSPQSAQRTEAVLALGNIAANESDLTSADVAVVEELLTQLAADNDISVRSSALASLALIDRERPLPANANLLIQIEGDVQPGSKIKIMLFPSTSEEGVVASAGFGKIIGVGEGIGVTPSRSKDFQLEPGSTMAIEMEVEIKKPGKYLLPVGVKFKTVDGAPHLIRRDIHLDAGRAGGSYAIVVPPEEVDDWE